ncbi:hypothetical protein CJU90_1901 [Yarrowia sp. C11]|nr:hypothetical protein CKK34_5929 [Yarrowia sp. E02]KAG5371837.1 hypothetical protein CJU90_1901 [Yarrowia sp. C11]
MADHSNVEPLSRAYTQPQCVSLLSQIADSVTCIVCQELMFLPCVLECGHSYCYDCTSTWFTKVNTCPSCRKECRKKPHISHAAAGVAESLIAALVESDSSKKQEYADLKKRQTEEYKRDLAIHNSMFPGLFSDGEEGSDFEFDASLASALDIDTHEGAFDSDPESSDSPMEGEPCNIYWFNRHNERRWLDWGLGINDVILQSILRHRVQVAIRVGDATEHTEQYHDAPDSHDASRAPTEEFHDARPSTRPPPECAIAERLPRGFFGFDPHIPPLETPDVSLGVRSPIKWIRVEPKKLTMGTADGQEHVFTRDQYHEVFDPRAGSDSEGYFSS